MGVNAIGIDFGTSKCVTTWYDDRTRRAELIRNAEGEDATPSLVYIGEQETLVGKSARDMLDDEQERANVITSIKSELAAKKRYAVPGRPSPVSVAAQILKKLKIDSERGHFREPVTHAVITHPANFDELRCDRLREAARQAGFEEVELLPEPVSAAIAYRQMGKNPEGNVLIYDLGAGTFDLALLAQDAEEYSGFRVALPPVGRTFGGDDMDQALYAYCDTIAQQKLGRPISLNNNQRDLRFLMDCRSRKENLSLRERSTFSSYLRDNNGTPLLFRHEVCRTDFESLVAPELEGTVRATRAMLDQAKAMKIAPESILLIGGSSRVPLVERLLAEALPIPPSSWEKRDIAVALGAAYHANALWTAKTVSPPVTKTGRRTLSEAEEAQVVSYEQAARAHYNAGHHSQALALLEAGYQIDPQHEGILQMLGATLVMTGNTDRGIAVLGELSRTYSDNPYYWQSLGKALELGRRYDEAVTAYRTSARLNQEGRAAADLERLLARLATKNEEKGVTAPPVLQAPPVVQPPPVFTLPNNDKDKASVVHPQRSASELGAGNLAMSRGNFAAAENHFQDAIRYADAAGSFVAYRGLGDAYAAQGKWAEACVAYDQAIGASRVPPGTGETIPVMLVLSRLLCIIGRFTDAESVASDLRRHNPRRSDVLTAYGIALAGQLGREPQAEAALLEALRYTTNYFDAEASLGRLYLRMGRITLGIDRLRHALKLRPQEAELAAELGEIYLSQNMIPHAYEVLQNAERVTQSPRLQELRAKLQQGAPPVYFSNKGVG